MPIKVVPPWLKSEKTLPRERWVVVRPSSVLSCSSMVGTLVLTWVTQITQISKIIPYHEPSWWHSTVMFQVEVLSVAWEVFNSIHKGIRVCCMPFYIKTMLCWSCQEELGGVKQIKNGKRSHLSGKSMEKRSVLYISSKMEQAQICCKSMEKIDGLDGMQCLETMTLILTCSLRSLV